AAATDVRLVLHLSLLLPPASAQNQHNRADAAAGAAVGAATQTAPAPTSSPASGPATRPATGAAAAPATGANGNGPATRPAATKISMNFQDAPIDSVLNYLSEAAGFSIIKDTSITGKVTVISKQPVTPEEAVVLLNSVLKTKDYTAIQMEPRILKVVPRATAEKSNVPVHYGADPAKIPQTDEIVTQVIPVK